MSDAGAERIAVTLLLPKAQATALLTAASCAGTLDAHGRVVMDHFVLARDAGALEAVSKSVSQPVQTLFEGHFNGA